MKDDNSERALIQYYDNMAKSNYELTTPPSIRTETGNGTGNWIYSQMLELPPPRHCVEST